MTEDERQQRMDAIAALAVNNHDEADGELCAVEYVNHVAGVLHSDRGNSVVSEVLAAFAREANDNNDGFRRLAMLRGRGERPAILSMLDTAADLAIERERAFLFINKALYAAIDTLAEGGLHDDADTIRDAMPAKDRDSAEILYGLCVKTNLSHAEDLPRRYKAHIVTSAGAAARHASHADATIGHLSAAAQAAYDAIDPDHRKGAETLELLLEACQIK